MFSIKITITAHPGDFWVSSQGFMCEKRLLFLKKFSSGLISAFRLIELIASDKSGVSGPRRRHPHKAADGGIQVAYDGPRDEL